jgi:flagellar hook-associated protein 2
MLTAAGVGSGLDIEGLITQLVAAERDPVEARLERKESELKQEISAFGTLKSALSTFQDSASNLNRLSTYNQRTAASTNDDVVGITARAGAEPGNYSLTVSQLAKAHSLASGSYTSVNDPVGSGTLTFRFGTTSYSEVPEGSEQIPAYTGFAVNGERTQAEVVIDASNNTLEGVRDAINDADVGVSAVIVNDGTGFRLLISSEESGAENSLQISVDDADGNNADQGGLSALAFNGGGSGMTQTLAGQDAVFTLNGLEISHSSNLAEDVIEGISLDLKELTDTGSVTVSVAEDTESLKEGIKDFVDKYNEYLNTINRLTAYDPGTKVAGALQGDFSARSVTSQLRQALTSSVEGFEGAFTSLAEVGITSQVDGTLSISDTKLDAALEEHYDDFVKLFASIGDPTDSSINYVSATDDTMVGSYAVNISQVATRASLNGNAIGFPRTIDASGDTLTVSVDGFASGPIALTQASYATGEALAAELQSRINSDEQLLANGASVIVSYVNNRFEMSSARYGSASALAINSADANTQAQLGLGVATAADGVDVAGTIGGFAATGSGQTLVGDEGSDVFGLKLLVEGGTTGDRGTLDYTRGIAWKLDSLISSFLESDGMLDSRTDSLQQRMDRLDDKREDLDRRIEGIEARYRLQFTTLDTLLAQLQSTSSYLTQQLASLPGPRTQN